MPLTGLESVQADFAWYCEENDTEDESYTRVHEIAALLVMVKFLALVRDALASGSLAKSVAIIATAHDFDITGRFLPAGFNPNIANPVSPTTSDSDIANQSAPAFLQRCLQLIRDALRTKGRR